MKHMIALCMCGTYTLAFPNINISASRKTIILGGVAVTVLAGFIGLYYYNMAPESPQSDEGDKTRQTPRV